MVTWKRPRSVSLTAWILLRPALCQLRDSQDRGQGPEGCVRPPRSAHLSLAWLGAYRTGQGLLTALYCDRLKESHQHSSFPEGETMSQPVRKVAQEYTLEICDSLQVSWNPDGERDYFQAGRTQVQINGQKLDALKGAEERFRSLNPMAQRQPGRRPDALVRLRFLRLGPHTLSGTSAANTLSSKAGLKTSS